MIPLETTPLQSKILVKLQRAHEAGKQSTTRTLMRNSTLDLETIQTTLYELASMGLVAVAPSPAGRRGRPTTFYKPVYKIHYVDTSGKAGVFYDPDQAQAPIPKHVASGVGFVSSDAQPTPPDPVSGKVDLTPKRLRYPEDREEVFEFIRTLVRDCVNVGKQAPLESELDAWLHARMDPLEAGKAKFDLMYFVPEAYYAGGLRRLPAHHPNNPRDSVAVTLRTVDAATTTEEAEWMVERKRAESYDEFMRKLEIAYAPEEPSEEPTSDTPESSEPTEV